MTKTTKAEVIKIIEIALEIDGGKLSENASSEEIEGWDSIGHLSILVALDKFYDGRIAAIPDMATANSVPKILNLLELNSLI